MKLREARFFKGFTQWDMALHSGISATRISLMERGYILPTYSERKSLADALGIGINDLHFEKKGTCNNG